MSGPLRRTLGLRDVVSLVIGTVIGSGVFVVPAAVLRDVGGSVKLALLVWLLAGILSLLGALTYGELGAMDGGSGGLYAYIRDAFGGGAAFLYGWSLFFVISSGSVATLSVAVSNYLGQLVTLGAPARTAVSLLVIALVTVTNVRGTRQSATVQNVTTAIKVGAIIVMAVCLSLLGREFAWQGTPVVPSPVSLAGGIGLAMVAVLWAYEGWQYASFAVGETVDPQRTFPRAMLLGAVALILIYVGANFAYVAALGPTRVMASERVAADAVSVVLGPGAARLIAIAIIISMYSAANGLTLTAPRAYFAMARDGTFFARLADVHPRFGTPAFAIIASSAWACVLAATGTFEQLLTYVVFTGWIFYALGALALIVFRRTRPNATRPYRVPGYPVTPILFLLSAMAIVGNTLINQPRQAVVGLFIVIAGLPAYAIWRRRGGRPTPGMREAPVSADGRAGFPLDTP